MTAEKETLQKSSRDLDRTRATLTAWLARKLPAGSVPEVTELTAPPTGQSSETLLFTATWYDHGVRQARRGLTAAGSNWAGRSSASGTAREPATPSTPPSR
jgi:hypothetical protein